MSACSSLDLTRQIREFAVRLLLAATHRITQSSRSKLCVEVRKRFNEKGRRSRNCWRSVDRAHEPASSATAAKIGMKGEARRSLTPSFHCSSYLLYFY